MSPDVSRGTLKGKGGATAISALRGSCVGAAPALAAFSMLCAPFLAAGPVFAIPVRGSGSADLPASGHTPSSEVHASPTPEPGDPPPPGYAAPASPQPGASARPPAGASARPPDTSGRAAGHHATKASPEPALAGLDPLSREAVARLRAYLRVDTTNPPGNEAAAARLLASWLREEGIEPKLFEAVRGRPNLVARLKANAPPIPGGGLSNQPLLLLHHMDVVLAERNRWHHSPFGGEISEGKLWGRGTLDMKGLGIMELLAFLRLKRQGVPLHRDVIFCAVADEEGGSTKGAEWLVKHHPEEVRCGELLNEGGAGIRVPSGKTVMGINTAERGALWVRVVAHGTPGHGSVSRPDGATRRLIRALARIEAAPTRYELGPEARSMFQAIGEAQGGALGFLLANLDKPFVLDLVAPVMAAQQPLLASVFGLSVNTTVLAAGSKVNVMPATASAEIDLRILPGHTVKETLAYLKGLLAEPNAEIQVIAAQEPSRSPADGPFFQALKRAVVHEYPGVRAAEMIAPGSTDSSYWREAMGTRAYGLIPVLASFAQLATYHGDDEFLSIDQIAAGTRVVCRAVEDAASGGSPASR